VCDVFVTCTVFSSTTVRGLESLIDAVGIMPTLGIIKLPLSLRYKVLFLVLVEDFIFIVSVCLSITQTEGF
jgi:hypothetical protein